MTDETLFSLALETPDPARRAALLAEVGAVDPALRARVEALLASHENASRFLEVPVLAAPAAPAAPTTPHVQTPAARAGPSVESIGASIGPYRLLERIGEGGMGVVWLAEQQEPVRRRVALKVIRAGLNNAQLIARFEAERQALALMEHPNIARIFDAGTTPAGTPYFVMELVAGEPLTYYCDYHCLPLRQRLELFVAVCQALQHAHTKGVIHRDVKPSNVLVASADAGPTPKVIDFGIAKVLGPGLTRQTLLTGHGVVGTLDYMSPEQAGFDATDVDTRSDLYSLGALLYELLTGTTPLTGLQQVPLAEALRRLREEEPPRPSARLNEDQDTLAAVATQRRTEPARLVRLVRGELDWIVMKCLDKDRNRRYETASGLARDLQRYLADDPVEACPPSFGYRLGKFLRKHRVSLATTAAFALLLILAGVSWSWSARQQAVRLQQRQQRHQTIGDELDRAADWQRQTRWSDARLAVARAEALLLDDDPEELRHRVAGVDAEVALVARLEAIRLEQTAPGKRAFDWGRADPAYRRAFQKYDLDVETLPPEDAARRIGASAIKEPLVAALDSWGFTKRAAGLAGWEHLHAVARLADGDAWRGRVRAAFLRREMDPKALAGLARDPEVRTLPPATVYILAQALVGTRQVPVALTVLREAQQRYPADFWISHTLAFVLSHTGNRADRLEAIGSYRVALALRPDSAGVYLNLAVALYDLGRWTEAETTLRQALGLRYDYAEAWNNLGTVLRQRRPAEAEAAFRKAIALDPELGEAHCNLGRTLQGQGKYAEALSYLKRGHELGQQLPNWPYPSAQWLRQAEQMLALQRRLPALLAGTDAPRSGERLLLVVVCKHARLYAASTRFYTEMFAVAPGLAQQFRAGHRFQAACVAALAGCGQGEDAAKLDDRERARLRTAALGWLEADLKAWTRTRKDEAQQRGAVLQHWQRHADLAGVRDPAALAQLPEPERQAWGKFWAEVQTLLADAGKAR
jgi:serine/threonine protein kinase/Flp pilus assembly protein TadD